MDNQPDVDVHVYRVNKANKVVLLALTALWPCCAMFISYEMLRHGRSMPDVLRFDLDWSLPLSILILFITIRLFKMRVTIGKSQIELVGGFRSYVIPFTEIAGRRHADGQGGFFLYRRGKSRVWVRGWLQQDEFYKRWRDSIYDLDKADRRERKLAGKQRAMDWSFDDNEQNPKIGGPDFSA